MNKLLENVMIQAINNNPQVLEMIADMNKRGLTPEEYFYEQAKKRGIDPNTILNQLR